MTALLDTGSQVSAVSESFYRQLIRQNQVKELPVANLVVSTAIGKKATSIKRQIFIQIIIEDIILEDPFLVIPYLTSEIIFGNDWLLRNNGIINYKQNYIEIGGKRLKNCSVIFERGALEKLICTQKNDTVQVYIIEAHKMALKENNQ